MADFLTMGGYGAYVWAAFGSTIVLLAALLWQSWRFARKRTAEVHALRRTRLTLAAAPAPIRARRLDRAAPGGPAAL